MLKFFVSSRLPCYDIEEPWGLFYYGETLFPMLVTLIMINGASLGWDGAGHQARAKGLNIGLSTQITSELPWTLSVVWSALGL